MDEKRGIPPERMGFWDVLAFILAALLNVLPLILLAIAVFAILLFVFKLLQ